MAIRPPVDTARRWRILAIAVGAIGLGGCGAEASDREALTQVAKQKLEPATAYEWSQQQRLTAPAPDFSTSFGSTVAATDDFLFVGSEHDVQVFSFNGTAWQLESALQPAVTTVTALAARASTVVVGAADEEATDLSISGAVYVSRRTGASWPSAAQKLEGEMDGDHFGRSVAAGTELIVVGAPANDEVADDAGAAYVFAHNESGWGPPTKLLPPDLPGVAYGGFGSAVAISSTDDTIVVGASSDSRLGVVAGTAYVFKRNGTDWVRSELLRDEPADYDIFGGAAAIEGTTILIGGVGRSEKGPDAGVAYVFSEVGSAWMQESKFLPDTIVDGDYFGASVALGDDVALVGAPYHDPNGAAYLFTRSGESWTQIPAFYPTDELALETFGVSVAVAGTRAMVGSPNADVDPGAVYLVAVANGDPCTRDTDCVSLSCVDGVCCDTPCAGACESCLAQQKALGPDGECGPIAEHGAPRSNECFANVTEPCGPTGFCDGHGECAFEVEGTVCGPPGCSEGAAAVSHACDGNGHCEPEASTCEPYQCLAGSCLQACTSDVHCSETAFCDDRSTCTPKSPLAGACSSGRECVSGHCADGVCCGDPCEGPCEACAEDKFVGTCVPVRGEPRDQHPACPQGSAKEPCLAAQCDGETTSACLEYVGPQVTCDVAGCDGTDAIQQGSCDASGSCQCPPGPHCNADRSAVVEENGSETQCGDFRCQVNICLKRCEVDDDCASGLDCNPTNQNCEALQTLGGANDSACGLATPRPGFPHRAPLWLLVVVVGALRRIRNRARVNIVSAQPLPKRWP